MQQSLQICPIVAKPSIHCNTCIQAQDAVLSREPSSVYFRKPNRPLPPPPDLPLALFLPIGCVPLPGNFGKLLPAAACFTCRAHLASASEEQCMQHEHAVDVKSLTHALARTCAHFVMAEFQRVNSNIQAWHTVLLVTLAVTSLPPGTAGG